MFQELHGKRLLVLGGSAWGNIIKAFAEENNISLVTVGNNPKSRLASLGEYHNIDSTNNEAMKQFIRNNNIDGVYLGGEEVVIRHAIEYLADLNMPCYCTKKQWNALMNKRSFKELCQLFDIPTALRIPYTPETPCEVPYPVITKPADGCASVGITICNNEGELRSGYQFAYDKSPTHEVLVEEYVNNSGMDVFFQITNGEVEWCALGDKYPVQFEEGAGSVAGARVLPSVYTTEFRDRFEVKLKNLFNYLGLYQGLIWMEVFHDGDKYYFNEVGYRPNGSLSIVGIDYLCGINTVAADIYFALTGKGSARGFSSLILKKTLMGKKKVCEYWVASKPGIIGEIKGIEELNNHPSILAVFPKYNIGSSIPHTNGFAQNFCVIHFAYDNVNEMKKMILFIRKTIKLLDQNGHDMIIHKTDSFIEHLLKDNSDL